MRHKRGLTPTPPSQAKCSAPGGKCPGLPTLQYGFFPAVNVLERFTRGGGASDVEGLMADTGIVGAEGDAFVSQVLEQSRHSRRLAVASCCLLYFLLPHLVIYSISFGSCSYATPFQRPLLPVFNNTTSHSPTTIRSAHLAREDAEAADGRIKFEGQCPTDREGRADTDRALPYAWQSERGEQWPGSVAAAAVVGLADGKQCIKYICMLLNYDCVPLPPVNIVHPIIAHASLNL